MSEFNLTPSPSYEREISIRPEELGELTWISRAFMKYLLMDERNIHDRTTEYLEIPDRSQISSFTSLDITVKETLSADEATTNITIRQDDNSRHLTLEVDDDIEPSDLVIATEAVTHTNGVTSEGVKEVGSYETVRRWISRALTGDESNAIMNPDMSFSDIVRKNVLFSSSKQETVGASKLLDQDTRLMLSGSLTNHYALSDPNLYNKPTRFFSTWPTEFVPAVEPTTGKVYYLARRHIVSHCPDDDRYSIDGSPFTSVRHSIEPEKDAIGDPAGIIDRLRVSPPIEDDDFLEVYSYIYNKYIR